LISGPQAFLAKEAPKYETGVRVILACAVGQFALAFCLRALLAWRNARRDREEAENPHNDDGSASTDALDGMSDATNFQNRRFRYHL
jgi:hypothetical protein